MKIKTAIKEALKAAKAIAKERKCDSCVAILRRNGSYAIYVSSSEELEFCYNRIGLEDIFADDWEVE